MGGSVHRNNVRNTSALTGRQNSSKAGFTNVIYWLKTCSRSRPRSLMSRKTDREKKGKIIQGNSSNYTIVRNEENATESNMPSNNAIQVQKLYTPLNSVSPTLLTSAWESCISICVHKQFHLKEIPDFLRVEHENPLEQHHVSRVHCNRFLLPVEKHRPNYKENKTLSISLFMWDPAGAYLEWVTKS